MNGHYLDIHVQPDPEFPAAHLMNALFAKLHRALVGQGAGLIGVSFPGVDTQPMLGTTLRLHAAQGAPLESLMASDWLRGMSDHVCLTSLALVPEQVRHRVVSRVQAQSSPERLRRRLMRRHSLTETEARERIPDSVAERLRLPYVQLRSTSTGQHFFLFIAHGPLLESPAAGEFSAYGLSQTGSVPWF
jgi:CRISPR-associated endonuclease Csy4